MQEALDPARLLDLLQHAAADGTVERAGVGVEPRKLVHEPEEFAEVIRIEEMAVARGVRGDDLHAQFQGSAEDARILAGTVDDRYGHLAPV
jgi:hypothetical protein